MKLRSRLIHTEHGRATKRVPRRYLIKAKHVRIRDAKHPRRMPDTGSRDTRIACRIPLLDDTELLSLEIRRSWHPIFPGDDDE